MGGQGSGTVDAALMCLDGTKITKDGEKEDTRFFDFLELPLGDYSNIQLTPEQSIRLRNFAVRMKYGTCAMIPLICAGTKCPIKAQCPFTMASNWPIGQGCPIEANYIKTKTVDYMQDFKVDPDSATEMSMVNRLIEIDIMDFRSNVGLAGGVDGEAQTLLQRIVMMGGEGSTEQLQVHPLLDIKDRLQKQRMQILEAMAHTRKERYKKAAALHQRDDEDAAHALSAMREQYKRLQKEGTTAISEIKKEAEEVKVDQEADWSEMDVE